jgi:hypothetical protein
MVRDTWPTGAVFLATNRRLFEETTMWALLSRRFQLWLVLAVGAPIASWLLGRLGQQLENRNGPTRISNVLQKGSSTIGGQARGPLARTTASKKSAGRP